MILIEVFETLAQEFKTVSSTSLHFSVELPKSKFLYMITSMHHRFIGEKQKLSKSTQKFNSLIRFRSRISHTNNSERVREREREREGKERFRPIS